MDLENLKYLVVGAGFFGSVIAERIAEDKKERVVVIEKRGHVGGNCFSEFDRETGIEYHKYGSHIFHTSEVKVWNYIKRFINLNSYRHKVLTKHNNKVFQMPINLDTINSFFNKNMNPVEAEEFIHYETAKENITDPINFEQKAISMMGRKLYEAFIKSYTIKHWGMDPKNLPAEIITRLPVRYNYKSDYFDDVWQGLPVEGYTNIFDKMLSHNNIDVYCNIDFFDIRHLIPDDCCIIYSGPIDRFFDYKFGRLGWRTLLFEKEILGMSDFQGTAVMNYADKSIPFTRIHEFKHLHEERDYSGKNTLIFREYSRDLTSNDDPYYPINTEEDRKIFNKYQEESEKLENFVFGGRLGSYQYLDMDETIGKALEIYEEKIKEDTKS